MERGFSRKDVEELTAEAAVFGAQGVLPVWVEEDGIRSPFCQVRNSRADAGDDRSLGGAARRYPAVRRGPQVRSWSPASASSACRWPRSLGIERSGWAFSGWSTSRCSNTTRGETPEGAASSLLPCRGWSDFEDLKKSRSILGTYAYDLVLNGVELGSGSIRISNPQVQEAVFEALGWRGTDQG